MLEPEAVQAALYAAAGEVQALVNHLGMAARSAGAAKLVFGSDLQASLRRALQFGRTELVSTDAPLGTAGILAQRYDVVVAAKTRTPQLAVQVRWHPRGEDHPGFAHAVVADIVRMAVVRATHGVEQAAVLVSAPARFWRWLPTFAEERQGFQLLTPDAEAAGNARSEFLEGSSWDFLFEQGLAPEVPERFWTATIAGADIRSPWLDSECRLLEVKGLGRTVSVRG